MVSHSSGSDDIQRVNLLVACLINVRLFVISYCQLSRLRIRPFHSQPAKLTIPGKDPPRSANPKHFAWKVHCQGLFYTTMAA